MSRCGQDKIEHNIFSREKRHMIVLSAHTKQETYISAGLSYVYMTVLPAARLVHYRSITIDIAALEAALETDRCCRCCQVSVPIYVSLLLMSGYILLGAFLFGLSENWEPLVAAYFCFITLSTIGFGDFVPGTSLDSWRSQKTVVCAVYLVCGLALIAMCFDLMQEEAKNKFRRLGRRLGLLSDDEMQQQGTPS